MVEPYDLRSNIKGKPGSQGTLFQVKDKGLLNPQQRWPKGYTPERLNEVREATKPIAMTPSRWMDEESLPDRPEVEQAIYSHRPRVQQAIARSTIPAEHLEGLKNIHGNPDMDDYGTYWPSRKEVGVDMSGLEPSRWDPNDDTDLDVQSSREAERTLIHEIGHHGHNDGTTSRGSLEAHNTIRRVAETHAWQDKSPYSERPTGSGIAMAENKVQAGVHEALADNYMTEHYRTHGRNPQRVTEGRYEENFDPGEREKQYPGYNDVRSPTRNLGPQFHQEHLF